MIDRTNVIISISIKVSNSKSTQAGCNVFSKEYNTHKRQAAFSSKKNCFAVETRLSLKLWLLMRLASNPYDERRVVIMM